MAHDPHELHWWQGLGAAIAALLAGLGIGRRTGRRGDDEVANDEHERRRSAVAEMIEAHREQMAALIDTIRTEGHEQRATLHAMGKSIETRLERQSESIGRLSGQVEELLQRGPRGHL